MSQLSKAKSVIAVGAIFDVTNHYITRVDHSCYGTTRRTVTKTNTAGYAFDGGWTLRWPKATQVETDPDGTVRIYGGGNGQQPTDLFMTLRPVSLGMSDITLGTVVQHVTDGWYGIVLGFRYVPAGHIGGVPIPAHARPVVLWDDATDPMVWPASVLIPVPPAVGIDA